ncbi:SCO7613 C-terminal domain-containing membrane protein [Kribbella sp. CA-293567]|uniref:SCO7613 C-terminal domain-containing membrane protein n=1 Tax=Kribbella sp. CA-293567 TaxID=3002436 RepID=UPI0022DD72CF|nr:hypothetical protein [Kribbella sp. CA-293567]WBQ02293.1 hypothetical protein OX958_20120 [Kribbella sp. CA-293567]
MSPQATLLSLGVLLLLAAGVTFLAVTWDSLPVPIQAAIIATLATISLISSIPAARHKLTGTAEALAILGTGLLTVDLYGARALGLISSDTVDGLTYFGVAAAIVAATNLLMSRIAPTVITYGVAAVVIGQLPLPFLLADRLPLAAFLLGLLIQVTITLLWSVKGTKAVRLTGATCAALVFWALMFIGCVRIFLSLVAHYSIRTRPAISDFLNNSPTALFPVLATTAVLCLAAITGIALLRKTPLPRALPPTFAESACTAAAALAVATCLPQLPTAGRWLDTGLATALALIVLLMAKRTGVRGAAAWTATSVVALVNFMFCAMTEDLVQLALISAIVSALALIAVWRKQLQPTPAALTASLTAQLAAVLATYDGLFTPRTGAIVLAVIAALSIAAACLITNPPLERTLLSCATAAAALAEFTALLDNTATLTGIVLTITAAPLVAYGMRPERREALLFAAALLITANTAFALGTGATTIEWFTLPPAAALLAIGTYGWRTHPSWVYLAPGLLLGLVPSTLLANSNDDHLRTTFVVAAALTTILLGTRLSLQAPFLIGAAVLLKIALWQFLEVAPLIPRWTTLATAGLILLTVGATYERRLQNAKQAAHWVAALR